MSFKSNKQPLCRCCGKALRKHTHTYWCRKTANASPLTYEWSSEIVGEFRTKADCQRAVNLKVVSVRRSVDPEFISSFSAWDGESYVDEFFCTGSCATAFAYLVCRADLATTGPYRRARDKQREEAK